MAQNEHDRTQLKTDTENDYDSVETSSASGSVGSETEPPPPSLCCLQGCLAASAVGFSFFIALPTGILMIIYAKNNEDVSLLSAGSVLACLPAITFLILVVVCFHRNKFKKIRLRNNQISAKTRTEKPCRDTVKKF